MSPLSLGLSPWAMQQRGSMCCLCSPRPLSVWLCDWSACTLDTPVLCWETWPTSVLSCFCNPAVPDWPNCVDDWWRMVRFLPVSFTNMGMGPTSVPVCVIEESWMTVCVPKDCIDCLAICTVADRFDPYWFL